MCVRVYVCTDDLPPSIHQQQGAEITAGAGSELENVLVQSAGVGKNYTLINYLCKREFQGAGQAWTSSRQRFSVCKLSTDDAKRQIPADLLDRAPPTGGAAEH